jgi:DNA-binding transcriptional ArsR family regulator
MSSDAPRRLVTDPKALRALTHPTRLTLLEMLRREGPLTATQAGELIGESPASCSFHLRTLARYGFVEEAAGGHGRQRPWRARTAVTIDDRELTPEGRIAAQALIDLLREREQEWLRRWSATEDAYPPQWRAASGDFHSVRRMTADELREVSDLLSSIADRHADREPPPPGALPVALLLHAFPLRPPIEPAPPEPARPEPAPAEPARPEPAPPTAGDA